MPPPAALTARRAAARAIPVAATWPLPAKSPAARAIGRIPVLGPRRPCCRADPARECGRPALSSQPSGLVPLRPDRPNGRSQPSVPPIPFRRSRSLRSSLTSRRPLPGWAAALLREERPPRSSREPSRPGRAGPPAPHGPAQPRRQVPPCRDRYPARPSAGASAGPRRCDRSSLSRALPLDDRPCACWPRPPPLLRPPGLRLVAIEFTDATAAAAQARRPGVAVGRRT